MNKFNLIRLKKYGLIAEIVSAEGGSPHLVINLPSGRRTGFGAPPHPFESDKFSAATAHLSDADRREFAETDESCAIAARVLMALARHGDKLAAAAKNNSLSPDGKHAVAVEATTGALTEIGSHFVALERIGDDLKRQHDELYAVPSADGVAVPVDVEVRAMFRAMSVAEQMSALQGAGKPEFERLLTALKRSPLPLSEVHAQLVEEAWVSRVAEDKPEAVATLKIAEDNHEWALRLTQFIAAIIVNPSLSGTAGAIDSFGLYRILLPTGGVTVLEFRDDELRMFERRLAQAAA